MILYELILSNRNVKLNPTTEPSNKTNSAIIYKIYKSMLPYSEYCIKSPSRLIYPTESLKTNKHQHYATKQLAKIGGTCKQTLRKKPDNNGLLLHFHKC